MEGYRNFGTKLWNAARFCQMNGIAPRPGLRSRRARSAAQPLDPRTRRTPRWPRRPRRWRPTASTNTPTRLYRFVWNSFCDWYLELAKPVLNGADEAAKAETQGDRAHVLGTILRLLHPAMPFVTEELWDRFGYGRGVSLIRAPWPEPVAVRGAEAARAELDWVVALIGEVRAVRSEMNVPPSAPAPILLQDATPESLQRAERWIEAIRRLARATEVRRLDGALPKGSAQVVLDEATVVLPLPADRHRRRTHAPDQGARQGGRRGEEDRNRSWPTPTSCAARPRRWWRRTATASPLPVRDHAPERGAGAVVGLAQSPRDPLRGDLRGVCRSTAIG